MGRRPPHPQATGGVDGPDPPARNQAILGFLENERGIEALNVGDRDRPPAISRRRSTRSGQLPAELNLGDVRSRRRCRRLRGGLGRPRARSPERAHLVLERLARLSHDSPPSRTGSTTGAGG